MILNRPGGGPAALAHAGRGVGGGHEPGCHFGGQCRDAFVGAVCARRCGVDVGVDAGTDGRAQVLGRTVGVRLPLENIRLPLLVVGHAADTCVRSPAGLMPQLAARTRSPRQQVVTVSGGPALPARPGLDACEGRTPHGFIEQEAEVAAGIARFVRGSTY